MDNRAKISTNTKEGVRFCMTWQSADPQRGKQDNRYNFGQQKNSSIYLRLASFRLQGVRIIDSYFDQ